VAFNISTKKSRKKEGKKIRGKSKIIYSKNGKIKLNKWKQTKK
jgi:hypothetical protein